MSAAVGKPLDGEDESEKMYYDFDDPVIPQFTSRLNLGASSTCNFFN